MVSTTEPLESTSATPEATSATAEPACDAPEPTPSGWMRTHRRWWLVATLTLAALTAGGIAALLVLSDGSESTSALSATPAAAASDTVAAADIELTPVSPDPDTAATAPLPAAASAFTVSSPLPESHLTEPSVVITGLADPGSRVASGSDQADVAPDGSWTLALDLQPGANLLIITATDPAGTIASRAVRVFYDEPIRAAPAAPAPPPVYAWYTDLLGENPPRIRFVGTAPAGAWINVDSAYGNGNTVSGENGTWDLDVVFPDAPVGEGFRVTMSTVTVDDGTSALDFFFTRPQ